MKMDKIKRVFWMSGIVLMFSVTVVICSCFYVMSRAEAAEEIVEEKTQGGLVTGVVQEFSVNPTTQPEEQIIEPEYIESVVEGVPYHCNWIYDEKSSYTIPKENNITVLQAVEAVQNHVKAYYGFEYSKDTNVDINFGQYKYEPRSIYFVTINNNAVPGRIAAPGEEGYWCAVDGSTGKVLHSKQESYDEVYHNENVFKLDDEGNKVGWDYPSCFTNNKQLKQLKKECIKIAEKFLIASGDYTKEELTYVKAEAYEDIYPWTMGVTFEKGDEIIYVTIFAENKQVYEYYIN